MEHAVDTPYAPPHVLIGLGHTMTPAEARRALVERRTHRFPSSKIKSNMRLTAITVYNHQKLTRRYQARDGPDTLAYLICVAYGQDPPQHNEALPSSAIGDAKPFSLSHWESLYYALLAEIRSLYDDIQQNFETDFANGAFVLHFHGWDGSLQNSPWTALNMASQLEELWLLLMDACLLGPLDEAVRAEQCAQKFRGEYGEQNYRGRFAQAWSEMSTAHKEQAVGGAAGMVDTHSMSPADIMEMLWQRQIPLVHLACYETFQKDIRFKAKLAEYRLHPFAEEMPANQLENRLCTCTPECQCHLVCQYQVGSCQCKDNRDEIRRSVYWQEMIQAQVQGELEPPQTRRILGAPTSEIAQMKIAAMANPTAEMMQALRTTNATTYQNFPAMHHQRQRDRSNTNNSELAYVPGPKTPGRVKGGKDAFPLDFYKEIGSPGGRYPKFRPEVPKHSQPVYGSSCYTSNVPPRRPVPGPLSMATETNNQGSNFETSSPSSPLGPFPHSSPLSKPSYPLNQHQANNLPFTQSFPVVAAGNPREPENEFAEWDKLDVGPPNMLASASSAFTQPSADGHLLLARHSADSPQPRFAQARSDIPPLESSLPAAAEPLPDFIAPRPALKQRYVSAGGTAKLKDRPVIADFALPAAVTRGVAMSKEEVLQIWNEQQTKFPRRDSAVGTSRPSQDIAAGTSNSQRNSRELDEIMRGEKRGRTGSSSSFRKLKRVFSRHNTSSD